MHALSVLLYNIFWYCIYPICIVYAGLEFHRYIFWRFIAREEEEEENDMEEEYD